MILRGIWQTIYISFLISEQLTITIETENTLLLFPWCHPIPPNHSIKQTKNRKELGPHFLFCLIERNWYSCKVWWWYSLPFRNDCYTRLKIRSSHWYSRCTIASAIAFKRHNYDIGSATFLKKTNDEIYTPITLLCKQPHCWYKGNHNMFTWKSSFYCSSSHLASVQWNVKDDTALSNFSISGIRLSWPLAYSYCEARRVPRKEKACL